MKRKRFSIHDDFAEQLAAPSRAFPDRRGGRQYQLPRVSTMQLSPGLRTILYRFERAVRTEERVKCQSIVEGEAFKAVSRDLDRHKQALVRKLIRMQQSS